MSIVILETMTAVGYNTKGLEQKNMLCSFWDKNWSFRCSSG